MNPFFWLVARHRRDSLFIASLFGAILSLGLVGWFMRSPQFVGACSVVSMILLLAWVAWRSVQAFGEARQSGALEQLLATPLPVQEMLVGHWLGLKHLFVLPVGFALLLRVMAHLMPALQTAPALPIHRGLLLYLGVGYDALSFLVSLIAIFWLGLWLGLRRRKLPQAFLYTILFGLVLPTFVVCIPNVAIHLGLMGWARTRLLRDFRRVASGENSAHRQHIIRPHLLPNSNVPPVILQR